MPVGAARTARQRFSEEEAGILLIRLAVIGGNLAAYLLFFGEAGVPWLAWAMSLASAGLALALFASHRSGIELGGAYGWVILTATTVLIGTWVLATGGFSSPFYLLYFLAMFAIAMGLAPRLALGAAIAYAVSYTGIVAATGGLAGNGPEMAVRVLYIGFAGLLSMRHARAFDTWARTSNEMGDRAAQAEAGRERLSQFLESAPDAVIITDAAGRIVHANTQCERMFGYARSGLVGEPVELLVPERLRATHEHHRARYMSSPRGRPMGATRDLSGRRSDGTEFPVEISLAPIPMDGQMMVSASIRDVTQRRRIERQVHLLQTVPLVMQAEQDERAALSGALEVICGATGWPLAHAWRRAPDGTFALIGAWHPGAPDLQAIVEAAGSPTGHAEEGLPERLYRDKVAVWVPDVGGALPASPHLGVPGHLRAAAGIPVLGDGDVLAALVFYVSEPREEDERFVDILSGVANQIGIVLAKKRAESAASASQRESDEVRRLRELNTFKTTLINTAAHELYTPLTPIKLQLHRLHAPIAKLGASEKRSLEILERNVDRLTQLVQDVLQVARLQSGRLNVDLQPTPLEPVLVEAIEAFDEMARSRGVQLTLRRGVPAHVRGDGKRLSHVLFNLLSNAIKFTPAEGAVVLSAREERAEVIVCVEDSGMGIQAEDLPRMFEPFVQVHEATRTREGTGLGLYIAKGIVELHGGRIWVESDGPGKGARFSFTLPVIAWPDGRAVPERAAPEPQRASALARRARELI